MTETLFPCRLCGGKGMIYKTINKLAIMVKGSGIPFYDERCACADCMYAYQENLHINQWNRRNEKNNPFIKEE